MNKLRWCNASPTKKNKTDSARKKRRQTTSSSRSRKVNLTGLSLSKSTQWSNQVFQSESVFWQSNVESNLHLHWSYCLSLYFITESFVLHTLREITLKEQVLNCFSCQNECAFQVSWCTHDHCRGVKIVSFKRQFEFLLNMLWDLWSIANDVRQLFNVEWQFFRKKVVPRYGSRNNLQLNYFKVHSSLCFPWNLLGLRFKIESSLSMIY